MSASQAAYREAESALHRNAAEALSQDLQRSQLDALVEGLVGNGVDVGIVAVAEVGQVGAAVDGGGGGAAGVAGSSPGGALHGGGRLELQHQSVVNAW